MSYALSANARKVLETDMVDSLIPRMRAVIMEIAEDVAHEDNPNDILLVDLVAQDVILALAEFLVQGRIAVESYAPILHPRQLRKRYARTFWEFEK